MSDGCFIIISPQPGFTVPDSLTIYPPRYRNLTDTSDSVPHLANIVQYLITIVQNWTDSVKRFRVSCLLFNLDDKCYKDYFLFNKPFTAAYLYIPSNSCIPQFMFPTFVLHMLKYLYFGINMYYKYRFPSNGACV